MAPSTGSPKLPSASPWKGRHPGSPVRRPPAGREVGNRTQSGCGLESSVSPARRTYVAKVMTKTPRAKLPWKGREQSEDTAKSPKFSFLLCSLRTLHTHRPTEPCPFSLLVFGSCEVAAGERWMKSSVKPTRHVAPLDVSKTLTELRGSSKVSSDCKRYQKSRLTSHNKTTKESDKPTYPVKAACWPRYAFLLVNLQKIQPSV